MNDVTVIFSGICLWWLTSPGYVLIPDLSSGPEPHTATIVAKKTAFAAGTCPEGFQEEKEHCFFTLNGAGEKGGVRIKLQTTTPAPKFRRQAFCGIPPLKRERPLALRPEYIPPHGERNVAWMEAVGGVPWPKIQPCKNLLDKCPRFVEWTVPAKAPARATLVLDNLRSGSPIAAVLNGGASIRINHWPTHPHENPEEREHHWCAYYRMVRFAKGYGGPPACQPPESMLCTTPVDESGSETLAGARRRYDTIACSNSQYP